MGIFQADAPFDLGSTFAGTRNGELINTDLEGQEFNFPISEKIATSLGIKGRTSGRQIRARIMRNTTGAALLGKRLARVGKTSVSASTKVTEYAGDEGEKYVFPIDPFLPAAGVADDDLFYVILRGPVGLLTPRTVGDIDSAIVAGDSIMCSADDEGRIVTAVDFGSISSAFDGTGHVIGTALGAAGATAVNTEVIVDIALPWA
jgi:hypothetical protein